MGRAKAERILAIRLACETGIRVHHPKVAGVFVRVVLSEGSLLPLVNYVLYLPEWFTMPDGEPIYIVDGTSSSDPEAALDSLETAVELAGGPVSLMRQLRPGVLEAASRLAEH